MSNQLTLSASHYNSVIIISSLNGTTSNQKALLAKDRHIATAEHCCIHRTAEAAHRLSATVHEIHIRSPAACEQNKSDALISLHEHTVANLPFPTLPIRSSLLSLCLRSRPTVLKSSPVQSSPLKSSTVFFLTRDLSDDPAHPRIEFKLD